MGRGTQHDLAGTAPMQAGDRHGAGHRNGWRYSLERIMGEVMRGAVTTWLVKHVV